MLPTQLTRLGRSIAFWLLLITLSPVADGEVRAGEPPLPDVTVEPWDSMLGAFFAPTAIPGNTIHIVVRDTAGAPVANANVTVQVGPAIELCAGAVLVATTNSQGAADITALGGGCQDHVPLSTIIRVSGVTVRSYSDAKSPDYDGSASNLRVDLADLVAFADEFGGAAPSACHDYNNSGTTGLEDLILFAPAFTTGSECN